MENNITSYFIRQGIIFSLINILLTLVIYFSGPDFIANHYILVPVFLLLLAIVYPIIITIQYRKANGNVLLFKDAYKISFFMLAVSGLITAIFGIILYHVIDPDYPRLIVERLTEKITEMMASAGLSEEKIQEALDKQNLSDKFTIKGQITSYLYSLVFYGIFSLIVAAVAKRSPEPFENQVN